MKSKSTTTKVLVITVLVALSFAYLLPIYVTVINSLKSIDEINNTNYLTPVLIPIDSAGALVRLASTTKDSCATANVPVPAASRHR